MNRSMRAVHGVRTYMHEKRDDGRTEGQANYRSQAMIIPPPKEWQHPNADMTDAMLETRMYMYSISRYFTS